MLPYFKPLEHWTGPPSAARGTDGPIWVRRFKDTDLACAETVRALIALGVPAVDDYSAGVVEGVALTQATQKRGLRHSAATAFLRPALRRPNLTVLTGALALNLIMIGTRCAGVRAVHDGAVVDLYAERETIVSAGPSAARRCSCCRASGRRTPWPATAWRPSTTCRASAQI